MLLQNKNLNVITNSVIKEITIPEVINNVFTTFCFLKYTFPNKNSDGNVIYSPNDVYDNDPNIL